MAHNLDLVKRTNRQLKLRYPATFIWEDDICRKMVFEHLKIERYKNTFFLRIKKTLFINY